jgi:hypothetical protein
LSANIAQCDADQYQASHQHPDRMQTATLPPTSTASRTLDHSTATPFPPIHPRDPSLPRPIPGSADATPLPVTIQVYYAPQQVDKRARHTKSR